MAAGDIPKRKLDDLVSFVGTHDCGSATVREILENKKPSIWTVSPERTVFEALKLMAEKEVGALVVVEGEKVIGVLSERDYARRIILIGKTSKETAVREIMSSPVQCITPDKMVAECMGLMTSKHIRHLPVIDDGKLVGICSIGDLVKSIISEQGHRIQQFENYIRGIYPA